MHLEELQATDGRCMRSETVLWKMHTEKFSHWVKEKVSIVYTYLLYNIWSISVIIVIMLYLSDTLDPF